MIERNLLRTIQRSEKAGFINVIYGPRRVGKTILLEQIVQTTKNIASVVFNGDTEEARNLLSSTSETQLSKAVESYDLIAVDEAQRINNIGLSLKILIDKYPNKKFYVTGSSSIDIAQGLKESLTGRTTKYRLYPLSTGELTEGLENYKKGTILKDQLLYGGYPYLQQVTTNKEKQLYLESIVEDYLFRDILMLKDVNQPETLRKLATLLAFQIGSEVSLNELANNLNVDVKTVGRYISLLKQGFIIFELGTYSTNLRKEVAKSKKYYFWDLGIRNAVIRQYFDLDSRKDVGDLWENFLAVERVKKQEYSKTQVSNYFWRTYEKAEIDWVEIGVDNKIQPYEFKLSPKGAKTPKAFRDKYEAEVKEINRENYLDFVL
jgi:uncharacterized protein